MFSGTGGALPVLVAARVAESPTFKSQRTASVSPLLAPWRLYPDPHRAPYPSYSMVHRALGLKICILAIILLSLLGSEDMRMRDRRYRVHKRPGSGKVDSSKSFDDLLREMRKIRMAITAIIPLMVLTGKICVFTATRMNTAGDCLVII